mgnify:CR=1 FL=1
MTVTKYPNPVYEEYKRTGKRPRGAKRPVLCLHLAERVEHRAGCGGFSCMHKCGLATSRDDVALHLGGLDANGEYTTRPSEDCQDCPGYQNKRAK